MLIPALKIIQLKANVVSSQKAELVKQKIGELCSKSIR
jgi:hypothetical protein